MSKEQHQSNPIEEEAENLERKFGDDAEVYAKTRGEAADIAGLKSDKAHWEDVARTLSEGEER